jgi:hypothetical protein
MVVISSRTPEGEPNRCPVCQHEIRLEPSWGTRDAPCPYCNHLLWFSSVGAASSERHPLEFDPLELDRLIRLAVARLGPPDRGTAVVLASIHERKWVWALEQHLAEARTWEDLFTRLWEDKQSSLGVV